MLVLLDLACQSPSLLNRGKLVSLFEVNLCSINSNPMSLVGGGGLMSQSHLSGGSCASLPYNQNSTAMITDQFVAEVNAASLRTDKEMANLSVAEKKCAVTGVVALADKNLLPPPTVVIHSPESIQMQWDRRYTYIPEPVGLLNAGNTCFLNSVLQCLTFTAPLANYFLNNGHKRESNCGEFCIMCRLQNHVKACFTINSRFYKPNGILERLQMIARHMERGRQEDAHEFLRCLTEAMQKRLLINYKNLDAFSQETTLLSQIFGGYLRSQVVCCICGGVSNTYEPFLDISLDVKDVNSVDEALKNFIRVETLDNDNMYGCDSCLRKVKAYKRFTIHQAPRVLTFQLKRYSANSSIKLNNRTNFPISLDIYRYLSDTLDGAPTHIYYELYGVLVHCGLTTTSGHYYCCAKSSNKNWYKLNDGVVTQIQVSDVLREEAYLLFYMQSGIKKMAPNSAPKLTLSGSQLNKSSSDGITVSSLSSRIASSTNSVSKSTQNGSQVASVSATASKSTPNGNRTAALIGPQLPHNVNTVINGIKTAETDSNYTQLPRTSSTISKLVTHNGSSSGALLISRPTTLAIPGDSGVSGKSVLQPMGHTITGNNQPSCTQSGIVPIKSVDARCKIVFNIKSSGFNKGVKLPEPVRETPSSKLVPYDEGVSDDSECENDRLEVVSVDTSKTVTAEDTAVNSSCLATSSDAVDALLLETRITNMPTLTVEPLCDIDCSHQLPETLSLDNTIMHVKCDHSHKSRILSNGAISSARSNPPLVTEDHVQQCCGVVASCCVETVPEISALSSTGLASEVSEVCEHVNSAVDHFVDRTVEHRSVKRKHRHRNRSKSGKRRKRNSKSDSESSDEMEYIWVEKVSVNVATRSLSQQVNGATSSSVDAGTNVVDSNLDISSKDSCMVQQVNGSNQKRLDHGDCAHISRLTNGTDLEDHSRRDPRRVVSQTHHRHRSSDGSETSFNSCRRSHSRDRRRLFDDRQSSYYRDRTLQSHRHRSRDYNPSYYGDHKSRMYRSSHYESSRAVSRDSSHSLEHRDRMLNNNKRRNIESSSPGGSLENCRVRSSHVMRFDDHKKHRKF